MEAVEEIVVLDSVPSISKSEDTEVVSKETNEVCDSNGVECDLKSEEANSNENNIENIIIETGDVIDEQELRVNEEHCNNAISVPEIIPINKSDLVIDEEVTGKEIIIQDAEVAVTVVTTEIIEDHTETKPEISNKEEIITETVEEIIDPTNSSIITEDVKFETEILIEENDVNENVLTNEEIDSSNYILSDIAPNIELSEVLRSSDVADNSENNNSTDKHEVFNKEELLDILEGNDVNENNDNIETVKSIPNKLTDAEIALKQLSKLKVNKSKRKSKILEKTSKANKVLPENDSDNKSVNSKPTKVLPENDSNNKSVNSKPTKVLPENDSENKSVNNKPTKVLPENDSDNKSQTTKAKKNIVNVLVMDWEDDEATEAHQSNEIIEGDEELSKDSEKIKENQEERDGQVETDEHTTTDSLTMDDPLQTSNKSEDECPPRRLGRVIKKKVIFDPDNPDTFTKGKTPAKSKDVTISKDQTPSKKIKTEQNIQRSNSKSPLSKLQWKKPSPKNSKQYKRLTEVDKLLMDEGAVNMMYQLAPEAPKGRKNMRTKAEFIKKLQSSTPEGKEMKFRERKKELIKYEDGEPKKILSGKQRASLSSSVKSPASEDFETHSADDSIIYRRHSSSSYSSSCMSPRRLSDVEGGSTHSNARFSQQTLSAENQDDTKRNSNIEPEGHQAAFNPESDKSGSEVINKSDCLSIKEKLNSKLSLALNKRKRDASKSEKPAKQKRVSKSVEPKIENDLVPKEEIDKFNFVSITLDQRLAVICIQNTCEKLGVEVLKELEMALNYIDKRKDISITMFSSQCGTICSTLDLSLLLNENKEIRVHHAFELAESIRCLLSSVARHSKMVWSGVQGACTGVSLALAALSDVAVSSDDATFALTPPQPGAAALTTRCTPLTRPLVNDLVIFGRRLTASEALRGGLISRTLYPERFDEQVFNIAKDVAAQPLQTVLLKKRLLSLKNTNESELAFFSCLEAERDLFVEHWTSREEQESLRSTLNA